VQPGVLIAAQLTGRAIVPAVYGLGWKVTLRSWDRFQVPLPFSRVTVRFGEALHVPRATDEAGREALRRELERRLRALTED
jgi:lysophospholipid acyltransferase (LPLAT)-like uncharacterized protein